MTHTFAAAPARSRTLPRASRAPHSKTPLSSSFSEKVQITYATALINAGVSLQALMARRGMAGGEAICRADDGGADFYRLAPRSGDITVEKPLFDGFHATDLDAQLRARGIETLVLAGFSTDCCVAATAGSGFHRGYHIFVAGDACATYEAQWQEAALAQMARHCALVVATGAIVAAWA